MRDKFLHFVAGFVISALGTWLFNPYVGVSLAIIAGALKEVIDLMGNGTPELADFIATALGGIFAATIVGV